MNKLMAEWSCQMPHDRISDYARFTIEYAQNARKSIRLEKSPSNSNRTHWTDERIFPIVPYVRMNGNEEFLDPTPSMAASAIRVNQDHPELSVTGTTRELLDWSKSAKPMRRYSQPGRFNVKVLPQCQASLEKITDLHAKSDYLDLVERLKAGKSVKSFLTSSQSDALLGSWSIHHFGLGAKKKGKRYTLFTYRVLSSEYSDDMYFLDVVKHPEKRSYYKYLMPLLEGVVENCPEGGFIEIKGIAELQFDFSPKDIEALTRNRIMPIIRVSGKYIMPLSSHMRMLMLVNRRERSTNASV